MNDLEADPVARRRKKNENIRRETTISKMKKKLFAYICCVFLK